MKISYCTTCSGRLWQLKKTIEHNLSFTERNKFELCILAYNDHSVEPFLTQNYGEFIKDGRLKIKTIKDPTPFSCGYVKNFSHQMATGKILFNLDADNFICNAHKYLLNLKENEILKNINIGKGDGRSGRIGLYRSYFDQIGGYHDVGRADDLDLVLRCLRQGVKLVAMNCTIPPIPNTQ